ncbi:MAG TPA: Tm-1-like ATP-binding domain-containing protein [Mobilitalea sp.]|nr:Tm-1-like ATP-binding domain-containing protein [Mobilitalea sp.]
MKTIAIIGSCDTKYKEIAYMRELIEKEGINALVINVATGPDRSYGYDISREELVSIMGTDWNNLEPKTKAFLITRKRLAGCKKHMEIKCLRWCAWADWILSILM